MFEIQGKYSKAIVYAEGVDNSAMSQALTICNQPITENASVRFMPDIHAGAQCPIGTSIMIPKNKSLRICPNIVSDDIGCSMSAYKITNEVDVQKLDDVINQYVPTGSCTYDNYQCYDEQQKLISQLTFVLHDVDHVLKSCGSLGGGNHFIEVGKDNEGNHWLTIHSGSRNFGAQVGRHHQNVAYTQQHKTVIQSTIQKLKDEGRFSEIEKTISHLKKTLPKVSKNLAYLEDDALVKDYLSDMNIAIKWAKLSHKIMAETIFKHMGWKAPTDSFISMHNYAEELDDCVIIRKGSTSAQAGERLIIPINMADGSIFATGKGNVDWNYSAPHGAGRVLSRSAAKEQLVLSDMQELMADVYTTSVCDVTLDESPQAYKPIEAIMNTIGDTVTIDCIVKPIYNYKAHVEHPLETIIAQKIAEKKAKQKARQGSVK